MKCPHCNNKIGLIFKPLKKKNKLTVCPNCSQVVEVYMDTTLALIAIPLLMGASITVGYFLKPYFSFSYHISGIASGICIALLFKVKKGKLT